MKTNYTNGRSVNIRLESSDGTTYFEFMNASLSKTGLNDKVRTISGLGSVIYDDTRNLIGLSSDTRDKIINNLHPETCRIKIPNDGSCTTLYHCDDNGDNCVDRTAEAILLDADNCVWEIPYCEFSSYTTTVDTDIVDRTSTTGPSGGSSPPGLGGGKLKKQTWTKMTIGEKVMKMTSSLIPIKKMTIVVAKEQENAKISIEALDSRPASVRKINGKVSNYIEINKTNIEDDAISSATIEFQVSVEWLTNESLEKQSIVLYRYNGGWNELSTSIVAEGSDYINYTATTPGFSFFMIGEKGYADTASETTTTTSDEITSTTQQVADEVEMSGDDENDEVDVTDSDDDEKSKTINLEWLGLAAGIVVLLVLIIMLLSWEHSKHLKKLQKKK